MTNEQLNMMKHFIFLNYKFWLLGPREKVNAAISHACGLWTPKLLNPL